MSYCSLTANFISKLFDFLHEGIFKSHVVHFFTIFTLVLIIKQHFGFDRHGEFPLLANFYTFRIPLNDVEHKI